MMNENSTNNRMKKIDFHTHYLSPGYVQFLDRHFDGLGDGVATPPWSVETALACMDAVDIDYAIPAISSPHINMGDRNETLELAQEVNEFGAAMKKAAPQRLGFAATLPLPYIEESIKEIRRSLKVDQASAIALPTNSKGLYLGDPLLDPVMEALNQEKALVMLHPNAPGSDNSSVNKKLPKPLMEFFFDTTRTVLNMMENGIFTRFPDITFIIPHAGAVLPVIADRVALIGAIKKDVDEDNMNIMKVLKNVYFDVAGVVLPRQLPLLLQLADPSKILYGSDAPYTPVKLIQTFSDQLENTDLLTDAFKKDLFYHNGLPLLEKIGWIPATKTDGSALSKEV